MQILKERKRQEVKEIFKTCDEFINHIKTINDKINFENLLILDKINEIYNIMLEEEGVIQWIRFDRWLPSKFGFKKSNLLTHDFWLERGWSEEYSTYQISTITKERANIAVKTKIIDKQKIVFNGDEIKIIFKGSEFNSKTYPCCGECGSKLNLVKKNINNVSDIFTYTIIDCSNESCISKNYSKSELYKTFLPKDVANVKLKKINETIKNSNKLCVESWLNKGYTEEEAREKISVIQSNYSNMVNNRFVVSKENLKNNGYSEEEIENITATPTTERYWVNKGLSNDEAKIKVSELQKENSDKLVQKRKDNPELYSATTQTQLGYWVNKGYSDDEAIEKLSDRQTTFSKEICLQKYGEVEGLKRFNKRNSRWKKSIIDGGDLTCGFSKISQELCYKLLENYDIKDRHQIHFGSHNKEYFINLPNNEFYQYDFTDKINKKIIEYNGDIFHGNPKKYKPNDYPNPLRKTITAQEIWVKDARKITVAKEKGFEVLVVWDSEYKNNKQEIINKCIAFLNKK